MSSISTLNLQQTTALIKQDTLYKHTQTHTNTDIRTHTHTHTRTNTDSPTPGSPLCFSFWCWSRKGHFFRAARSPDTLSVGSGWAPTLEWASWGTINTTRTNHTHQ